MRRRTLILAGGALVLSAGFHGRGAWGADGAKPRLALVLKTRANPYFIEMERGAREAASRLGADLTVRAAAQETSVDEMVEIVREVTASRVQAIIIAPADSVKLVPPLKQARDAGIVIVNVDNRLDREFSKSFGLGEVPFISVNNARAAQQVVRSIAETVTVPTKAAVIEGIQGAANAQARKIGALKAFAENPNISVVASESANWRGDEAHKVAGRILSAHPDLGILFCANDVMALGAIRALAERGNKSVRVIGFDALPAALAALHEGSLAATVDQQAASQGVQAVQMAMDLLGGKPIAAETMIEVRVVRGAKNR